MLLLNPIVSGSMTMSGSMSVNNQTLDQYISSSVSTQGLSVSASYALTASYALNAAGGGGGGADSDLGTYGLVGLEQEYYAISATSS